MAIVDIPTKSFILTNGEYWRFDSGRDATYEDSLVSAIPAMTSDASPSGIARASASINGGEAFRAFDGIIDHNGWQISGATSGWLEYEFPRDIIIGSYSLTKGSSGSPGAMPKEFTFEGWDGVSWIVLDSRNINVADWTNFIPKRYTIENKKAYKKYRINITTVSSSTYLIIPEMGMYERAILNPVTKQKWEVISKTLPSKDTFISDGMDDLSVLDRKEITLNTLMDDNGANGELLGKGRVFKEAISLKELIEIKKISVK